MMYKMIEDYCRNCKIKLAQSHVDGSSSSSSSTSLLVLGSTYFYVPISTYLYILYLYASLSDCTSLLRIRVVLRYVVTNY